MSRALAFVLISILCCSIYTVNAIPDFNALQNELNTAKAKWESMKLESYKMTVSRQCGDCNEASKGPFVLTVKGNTITSLSPNNTFGQKIPTVLGFFDLLQKAIDKGVDKLVVTYDGVFGYPTAIFIDNVIEFEGDEDDFTISVTEVKAPPEKKTSISDLLALLPNGGGKSGNLLKLVANGGTATDVLNAVLADRNFNRG